MKSLREQMYDWTVAAAFAEAGEWETAREMVPDRRLCPEPNRMDRIFAAVAFAEAGLQREAADLLDSPARTTSSGVNGVPGFGLQRAGLGL